MPRPHLTLFFDLHSPYSYLAFYVLHVSIAADLDPNPGHNHKPLLTDNMINIRRIRRYSGNAM